MAAEGFLKLLGPDVTEAMLAGRPVPGRSTAATGQSSSSTAAAPPLSRAKLEEMLDGMNVGKIEMSPFRKQGGPILPVSIWEPEGANGGYIRVRADMPGCNKLLVTADPEKNSMKIKGYEEVITMHGISDAGVVRRTYIWSLLFDRYRFPELDFVYQFTDGVLFLNVRSTQPARGPANLGVTLKAQETEAAFEMTRESAINPLVALGKDRYCYHDFKAKAFVFGVDMPGISENDSLDLHVVNLNTIKFFGKTRTAADYGESSRKQEREYDGMLKVNMNQMDPKSAQFHVSHGVFWIQVPRRVPPLTPLQPHTRLVTLFHGTRKQHLGN